MTRSQADNWSIARSLAFLAAVFAIVLGSLLPFAAQAAAQPGEALVLCTTAGPKTIQAGDSGMDGPAGKVHLVECAACLIPVAGALPESTVIEITPPRRVVTVEAFNPAADYRLPPAQAPPRPPSTAPPTLV